MNLKINLIVLFSVLFQFAFSQLKNEYPIVSVIENDSVVIFSLKQSKKLIEINEQKKECFELKSILNNEIIQKDTIIYAQRKKIENLNSIVDEKQSIIKTKDELIQICEDEKGNLRKEIRKQKIGKWLSISGIIIVSVLGIIY
jgi:hypothetical protein